MKRYITRTYGLENGMSTIEEKFTALLFGNNLNTPLEKLLHEISDDKQEKHIVAKISLPLIGRKVIKNLIEDIELDPGITFKTLSHVGNFVSSHEEPISVKVIFHSQKGVRTSCLQPQLQELSSEVSRVDESESNTSLNTYEVDTVPQTLNSTGGEEKGQNELEDPLPGRQLKTGEDFCQCCTNTVVNSKYAIFETLLSECEFSK